MWIKCLVVIFVLLGSTNGHPLGNADTDNPPSAKQSATNIPISALDGYFQLRNKSGSSSTFLYVAGGNVTIYMNDLTTTNGLNSKSGESIIPIGTSVTEHAEGQSRSIGSDYITTHNIQKHKLHREKKTWLEASGTCSQEGGHLVVINTKAEEELVWNMTKAINAPDGVWIGVHLIFASKKWMTVENVPLNEVGYVHWAPNSPQGVNILCVSLKSDGLTNRNCESRFSFVCEIEQNH